jgi:hypothetical protein
MYSFINNKLAKNKTEILKYLSHPDSIYHAYSENRNLTYSAKVAAVEAILKSAYADEKIIIFSRFIDVLNEYYHLCDKLEIPSIIITGKDKDKYLEEKSRQFKYTNNMRVLLTTLQKASEGFNFEFATHIIILEFWWNPQKIFQAMSRIDRKTQKRNIFIYLLCYNKEGDKWLKEEYKIYDVMKKKIENTNETYNEISQNNELIDEEKGMEMRNMPRMKIFKNIKTFSNELKLFLNDFHKTEEIKEYYAIENHGKPIENTRLEMEMEIRDYTRCCETLLCYPWSIQFPNVSNYLNNLFSQLINGENGNKIINEIDRDNSFSFRSDQIEYDSFYPFIYLTHHVFDVIVNGMMEKVGVIMALCKRQDGSYHILSPRNYEINNIKEIVKLMNNFRINNISNIIIDNRNNINEIEKIMEFYKITPPKFILSLTSVIQELNQWSINNYNYVLTDADINDISIIFNRSTKNEANEIIKNYGNSNNIIQNNLYNQMSVIMNSFENIYNYPLSIRSIIGTTNINSLIYNIIYLVINKKQFMSRIEVNRYITMTTKKLLINGKELLPNWDIMNQPIYAR